MVVVDRFKMSSVEPLLEKFIQFVTFTVTMALSSTVPLSLFIKIAATQKQHAISIPSNYNMKDFRKMVAKSADIPKKECQLMIGSRTLPCRHMETMATAKVESGSIILVLHVAKSAGKPTVSRFRELIGHFKRDEDS